MSLFTFNIHEHSPSKEDVKKILEILNNNNLNLKTLMSQIEQLQQEVADLAASVDAEQVQIQALLDAQAATVASQQATIASLESVIADLKAQVANGGTPEQLQAVLDQLVVIKADVESTVPDAPVA